MPRRLARNPAGPRCRSGVRAREHVLARPSRVAASIAAVIALALSCVGAARAQVELTVAPGTVADPARLAASIAERSGVKVRVRTAEEPMWNLAAAIDDAPLAIVRGKFGAVPPERGRSDLLGHNGVAVIVNGRNTLAELRKEQLGDIYAHRVMRWNEVGGNDRPIVRVLKQQQNLPLATRQFLLPASGMRSTGDQVVDADLAAVLFVAVDPYAIGYVGVTKAAALVLEGARVKIVAIDGTLPDADQLRSGRYPLSWPVYLLARATLSANERRVREFLLGRAGRLLLSETGAIVPGDERK